MVKIRNKKRLRFAMRQYAEGKASQRYLAGLLDVTARRFRQIYREYSATGNIPAIGKNLGRPTKECPDEHRKIILDKYEKYRLNALYLESVIYAEDGIRIPHNTIHRILKENGMAKDDEKKKGRRKPWIRYERKHSLSAGHMDWHEPDNGQKVCVVLDDASRKILSGGEFGNATSENSVELVKEVLEKYGCIQALRETITDHGSQFYANKRNLDGFADHSFERFLGEKGIKHILCRIKHPQTNGKIEKWFDLYRVHRNRFPSFGDFVDWYNNRPHGSLNLRRAETPEQAFWRKMPEEYYYGIAAGALGWTD
jgi:putative transposase